MRSIIVILMVLVVSTLGHAATLNVPGQFQTIQTAINAAVNGDTVLVAPGTYVENIDFLGKAITVTSSQGPDVTIIDGGQPVNPNRGSVVIFENGESSSSVLDGFGITNGTGTLSYMGFHDGGGIYCDGTSPTITNNIIFKNSISSNPFNAGGGISCRLSSPDIINNTISDNTAGEGGGLMMYNKSSPRIENNMITNNLAVNHGGGIELFSGCAPTIIDNIITDNTASNYYGGGIVIATSCSGTLMNNTISGNSAGKRGGGIYCEVNCSPIITNNTIAENSTSNLGGGLYCRVNCSPFISNNMFTKNSAETGGGGIQIQSCSPLVANNIISENTAVGAGGGISTADDSSIIVNNIISGNKADYGGAYDGWYCSPVMTNNTFYGNIAVTAGGAISCNKDSAMEVINSIFWSNDAPTGSSIWIGEPAKPSSLTISYSDVEGGQASVQVQSGCTLNWGSGMISANPVFVNAAINDFHLTYPSPCKDTGNNSAVTETTDLEGDPRIAYGTVDMGADEFYTHLYWTGNATPGRNVELIFVGLPYTAPVGLFIGSGVLDPPMPSMWGDWFLEFPCFGPYVMPAIPANGVLVLGGTIPKTPPAPYSIPMQALIGAELTNLSVMDIK